MTVLDVSRGENLFASTLAVDIEGLMPELRQGVNILAQGQIGHSQSSEEVLRGAVCGKAVRILGYQLRQMDYDAVGYENHKIADDGLYPSFDHAVLLVKTSEREDDVIVDAAYLQFLAGLYLEREYIPEEEVIVFPTSYVGVVVSGLVKLRNERLERHPDPDILKKFANLYRLSDDMLAEYFSRIWEAGDYEQNGKRSLETDIARYKADKSAVTEPTRKLIETLGLV